MKIPPDSVQHPDVFNADPDTRGKKFGFPGSIPGTVRGTGRGSI
jgi:hypothetical protein